MHQLIDAVATNMKSSAKVVFIMVAATACAAFLMKILPTQEFMILAGSAFTFFFAAKGSDNPQEPLGGK